LILRHASDNSLYDINGEWREDILFIFVPFCHIKYIRENIENYLKVWQAENPSDSYIQKRIQTIQYEIITNNDGDDEAKEFILNNVENNSDFREEAVKFAIEDKKYEKAIKLCLDGENKDKSYPGLVHKWQKLRYEIYEKTGDISGQKEIAYNLTVKGEFDFYLKLKNLYSQGDEYSDEWYKVLEDILRMSSTPYPKEIYTKILLHEKMFPELLEYCKNNMARITEYHKYLLPGYKEDVSEIFSAYIRKSASQAFDRRLYAEVCEIIKKYAKACGKTKATEIISELKTQYAKRPAFVDELKKIKL